jgi:prolyl-tRNA editing enzyme YbaK/EbsC (Cys-tRNA(Pro) deacylase)
VFALANFVLTIRSRDVSMTTLQRCLDFLDNAHICYAHTKHSMAFTAMEVAFAEHLSPQKLAKTVVYAGAQGYGLAVLPPTT